MKTKILALAVAGALVLAGGLMALSHANAAQANSKPPISVKQEVASQQADTNPHVKDATDASEKESAGIQEKDNAEKEVKDANEAPEAKSGAESKGELQEDKNLPGGGHQDPERANVDHQFEGTE